MIPLKESIKCFYSLFDNLRRFRSTSKSEKTKLILDHFITFIDYSVVDIVLNNLNKNKTKKKKTKGFLNIKKSTIKFTEKTMIWCKLPYPNHPNGCPNYNKNPLCPPNSRYMKYILEQYNYFYLVYTIFDLKSHRKKMLFKHPNWSDRQANNLLYWQGSVKKILKDSIKKIYRLNPNSKKYLLFCGSGLKDKTFKQNNIYSMEAVGIDVFKTLKSNDINFEIKPKNKVILVSLLCSNKKITFKQKRLF